MADARASWSEVIAADPPRALTIWLCVKKCRQFGCRGLAEAALPPRLAHVIAMTTRATAAELRRRIGTTVHEPSAARQTRAATRRLPEALLQPNRSRRCAW